MSNDKVEIVRHMAETLMGGVVQAIDGKFRPGYASKNPALVNTMIHATAKLCQSEIDAEYQKGREVAHQE